MAESCGACFSVPSGWSPTDATSRLVRFLGVAALESIQTQVLRSGGAAPNRVRVGAGAR